MALFVAVHQHKAERCPAKDPKMGAMLLQHLNPANAKNAGISIHGEAVLEGKHTFHLILDAPSQQAVQQFLTPFAQAGSVEIYPASPCEVVVGRQGC